MDFTLFSSSYWVVAAKKIFNFSLIKISPRIKHFPPASRNHGRPKKTEPCVKAKTMGGKLLFVCNTNTLCILIPLACGYWNVLQKEEAWKPGSISRVGPAGMQEQAGTFLPLLPGHHQAGLQGGESLGQGRPSSCCSCAQGKEVKISQAGAELCHEETAAIPSRLPLSSLLPQSR